jgi:hypothetical protein
MMEAFALVIAPLSGLASGVKYLAMIKLFGLDDGIVLLDFDLPLRENVCLSKVLDQTIDPVVSVVWLGDHMGSQIFHLLTVFGEAFWQGCFMASRRHQIDFLIPLSKEQKW